MGTLKYIGTNRYPYEATELLHRQGMFFAPDLVLNQVPKQNPFVLARVPEVERRVVPRGPVYVLKGGDVGVVQAAPLGVA